MDSFRSARRATLPCGCNLVWDFPLLLKHPENLVLQFFSRKESLGNTESLSINLDPGDTEVIEPAQESIIPVAEEPDKDLELVSVFSRRLN